MSVELVYYLVGGLFVVIWTVWSCVLILLQKCKIEELEHELTAAQVKLIMERDGR